MADQNQKKEIKVDMNPDTARGHYSNLAFITHSSNDFFMDFIQVSPGMPQALLQSRIIMTPENAKNFLFALRENLAKYEAMFGEITQTTPKNAQGGNNGGEDIPNPFMA